MNKLQSGPVTGGMPPHRLFLRLEHTARPPMPWVWVIHREGEAAALRRALRGYRVAEEAWQSGRAALAKAGRAQAPDR
jgi:hypothetical protein